jgi:hypothetical protein
MIQWQYGSLDGSFSPGKGSAEGVARAGKGKRILLHSLTDEAGTHLANRMTPANGRERAHVFTLPEAVHLRTRKHGRPQKRLMVIVIEDGYDAKDLLQQLHAGGIQAQTSKLVWKT